MLHCIQNFPILAKTKEREVVLDLFEAALQSIQMAPVLEKSLAVDNDELTICGQPYVWKNFSRVFLLGFGKGSAAACKIIENKLGGKLTAGWDIDVSHEDFARLQFTKGSHPLPSAQNQQFAKRSIK